MCNAVSTYHRNIVKRPSEVDYIKKYFGSSLLTVLAVWELFLKVEV